jgi:hypothetical protein
MAPLESQEWIGEIEEMELDLGLDSEFDFGDPHKNCRSGGPKAFPAKATERITSTVCYVVAEWETKAGELSEGY